MSTSLSWCALVLSAIWYPTDWSTIDKEMTVAPIRNTATITRALSLNWNFKTLCNIVLNGLYFANKWIQTETTLVQK